MTNRQPVSLVKATGDAGIGMVMLAVLWILRLVLHGELVLTVLDALSDAAQAAQMMIGS